MSVNTPTVVQGTLNVARMSHRAGVVPVAGDFALHANFGTTAAIATIVGTESRVSAIVTCGGTGQGANPTVIFTYPGGAFRDANGATVVPIATVSRSAGASQLTIPWVVTACTATACTLTFVGTASGTESYGFALSLEA
jgi:hypothetical protein